LKISVKLRNGRKIGEINERVADIAAIGKVNWQIEKVKMTFERRKCFN